MLDAHSEFERDCQTAFENLRAALIELYDRIDADPANPQEVARRLKLNKTLTWNLSRVMSASDHIASVPNMPGASALEGFLDAARREGASATELAKVRAAAKTLAAAVELHVGDRATLELIADGIDSSRDDHLEFSRKLVFRGSSGLWGIQASTRLTTIFLAPNAGASDRLDIAMVRAFIGLRRLRSAVRWPIFHDRFWGSDTGLTTAERWLPLDPSADPLHGLPLLPKFSSVGSAGLEAVHHARGVDYILGEGPVGNSGAVDCFVGDFARSAVSKYRTASDATGEFGANIAAPTERLLFDILVHRDVHFPSKPTVLGFGGIFAGRTDEAEASRFPIPLPQSVALLPGTPPIVSTRTVPRYAELVNFVHDRMGWKPEEFRAYRLDLSYPPMGSTILIRFDLPEPPAAP